MDTIFKCEQCGEEVEGIEYHDGYLTVEQHYECPHCGFRRHWAYGKIMPEDSEYTEGCKDEND